MPLYTWRSGATQHPEDSVLQFFTDLISVAGVLSILNNHFKVQAQTVPDMTLQVLAGRAYVGGGSANFYPVRQTDVGVGTVTANSSGNTRIDTVILYIDLSQSANSDASNVAKLAVVPGTPAASPTAPSVGQIQAQIGSSNPYLKLANITVSSGATSITNGNISDVRTQMLTKMLAEQVWIDLTDAATIDIDLLRGMKFRVDQLGGNRTFTLTNYQLCVGKSFILDLGQDGTGSRTVIWFSIPQAFATGAVNVSNDTIDLTYDIKTGTPLIFTTSGTLPAGLATVTTYYAIRISATQIKVASSLANAQAGTAIDLTTQGTGSHVVNSQVRWSGGGSAPVLSTGKYRRDQFGFTLETESTIVGTVVAQDM